VRQDVNAGLFYDLVADHSRYNLGLARTGGVFLPLLEFNSQAFLAALLIVGGWQVLQPEPSVSVGDIVQFFFMAALFFSPIQVLGNQYNQAMAAMAGAERVFRLLDTRPDWTDPPDAATLPSITGRVELQQVSFAYEKDRPVLDAISFTAEAGRTVALVGHTGSGKSTIINLIAKFHLPTSGGILFDGHDLACVTSDSLHRQMGIVLQVNYLFTGSVMDNIRLAKPGATDEQIFEAAGKLDCIDLIESLPQGFATLVGEKGSGISLGQRQLICFTRAMLADPRILILDEATSSVDAITEARIQASLRKLLRGRTCFVVAHRLSTIRHADVVLVLDHGRIVEQGSHEQLLVQGGVYAELYRQFIRATES
jgi:ATP-binding cassette subfamily B protein